MKAAQLVGIREFRIVDSELAPPAPGEVQVRVAAVGICGSDLHNYTEGGIGDSPCRYPMVLGHEPAGTVLKTGEGVTGIAAGRSLRAGTRHRLRRLRDVPRGPCQSLRQHAFHELGRNSRLFPRRSQSAGSQSDSCAEARGPARGHADRAYRGGSALADLRLRKAGRDGDCLRRRANRIADDRRAEVRRRKTNLGRRAGSAPARDGEGDGSRCCSRYDARRGDRYAGHGPPRR